MNNETDRLYTFMTCEALFEWNVDVFDALGHRVLSHAEKMERGGKTFVKACASNVAMKVPARSCLMVSRLIPLDILYDLTPGTYTLVERRGNAVGSGMGKSPGLVISIVN